MSSLSDGRTEKFTQEFIYEINKKIEKNDWIVIYVSSRQEEEESKWNKRERYLIAPIKIDIKSSASAKEIVVKKESNNKSERFR